MHHLEAYDDLAMGRVRTAWRAWTPMLVFSCFCLVVGDMLFGFVSSKVCVTSADGQDTASFGGILAMPVCTQFTPALHAA